jgi:hypothetical protein
MCYSRLVISSPLLFFLLFSLRQLIKNIIFQALQPVYVILLYLLLEARLYTLEMLCTTFDVSRQLAERGEACLVCPLPRPRVRWLAESQDEEKLAYYAYGRSLAHARGGSQDEEKILLLPPLDIYSSSLP